MGCCNSKSTTNSTIDDDNQISLPSIASASTPALTSSPEQIINNYITADCVFRQRNGSAIDTQKQINKQRIEIICMGCFLYHNQQNINVLFRDCAIGGTKYRPDLIFIRGKKLYHVEIDENKHAAYDKTKEDERHAIIKTYCLQHYGTYRLVRFNPHTYGKLDTVESKLDIAEQFNRLLSNIDGLLMFESI